MERKKTAVALGLFDGVHLGHRAVIAKAAVMAENGLVPAVYTFRCGTLSAKQGRAVEYIYPDSHRDMLIRRLGISEIFSEDFGKVRGLSGESFVRDVLLGELGAAYVACGRDFRFGRNASCGISELCELCGRYGIELGIAEDVMSGGENISSRRIRELLAEGDMPAAAELLGESYTISAEVIHGEHLGHTIGFPTINQAFAESQLVPRFGVYGTDVKVGGRVHPAVTDIGVKPTVGGARRPLAETHIIGFDGDIYGETIDTAFRSFIRPELRFGSLDELKAQIAADVETAKH